MARISIKAACHIFKMEQQLGSGVGTTVLIINEERM